MILVYLVKIIWRSLILERSSKKIFVNISLVAKSIKFKCLIDWKFILQDWKLFSSVFSLILERSSIKEAKRKYTALFPGWRENTRSRKRYIDRVWERWGSRLTVAEEIAPLAVSFVAGGSGCRGVADTSVLHRIPRGMIYKAVGTEENDAVITGPGTRCCSGCSGARQPGLARSNASSWLPSLKNLSSRERHVNSSGLRDYLDHSR